MSFCDLTGKKALVTGGGRGIGFEIARTLRAAGAEVVISGSNAATLEKAAAELGATYVVADLSDPAQVDKLIAETNGVDILVNNAGITRDGLFIRQSDDQWRDVMNVNLDAAVKLTRGLIMAMSRKSFGRVINITSIVAHMGNIGQTNYIAAKSAMTGFTKALSKEVARRNVTVNAIAPGFIETEMTAKLGEKTHQEFADMIPMRKFGSSQDIANAVRFLASEEAGYVTGTTLHVNGGMYV